MDVKNIKVIVFDFDETLYSGGDWSNYFEHCTKLLVQLGCFKTTFEAKKYIMQKYPDIEGFDMKVLHYMVDNNISTYIFRDYLNENVYNILKNPKLKFIDYSLLNVLAKKYKLFIASTSSNNYLKHYMKEFGIDINVFEKIISNNFEPQDLTKRTCFKKIINEYNVRPNEILMIGDSLINDIEPAKSLGIQTYQVKNVTDTENFIKKLL